MVPSAKSYALNELGTKLAFFIGRVAAIVTAIAR